MTDSKTRAIIMTCELCGRDKPLTKHHLIPRTVHSNKWFKKRYTKLEMSEGIMICQDCHSAIHNLIPSEKELARRYNTKKKLLQHEAVRHFVEWIRTR